ncbi:MAG TPA: SDR family NAD(P)-dependent oxidoreductase [Rhizomicrobium sp.]|jgi:NADP-dependent 3-hydroxy acid dehydrogenase YdfG
MQDLAGKVAFITGGGSGVAFGQAKVFAEEAGMKVVIADIRQDHLDQAMAHFKQKNLPVHAIKLDITDRAAYAAARDETEKVFGPVDLLCNTAGVSQFGPLEQASFDDWDWEIDVNLKGMVNGVMTFLPSMIERKSGHIVNTASMSAFVALPRTSIYCTTKYAVRGYSECLKLELEKFGIGVSILCPGGVNTNIHESVLSRPDRYAKTGWYGNDPAVFAHLKSVIETGIDPVDLARIVMEAVKRNDFWILPYPEFVPTLEQYNAEVIAALKQYENDPDYLRRKSAGRGMPGAPVKKD